MTTFPLHAGSSSPLAQVPHAVPTSTAASDLMALTSDMDSLAEHMRHCASAQSQWPRLHWALQSLHGLVSPRLVTAGALGTLMAVAAISVAVLLGWVAAA